MKRCLNLLSQFLIVCALIDFIGCNITYETSRQDPDQRDPVLDWLSNTLDEPLQSVPSDRCAECKCGRTNQETRIIGGTETRVNQYPWMAMLLYNWRFICGGSLISDQHVVTAAHCVNGAAPGKFSVVLMKHNRFNAPAETPITRMVEQVIVHDKYNSSTVDNDIALLKLNQTIQFDQKIRPVCLPPAKKCLVGYDGIVTGWGATSEHGPLAVTLQQTTVPIWSNEACRKTNYGDVITGNMLCAGYLQGGKDTCQGDSGGPLHVIDKHRKPEIVHLLAGITSFGQGCGEPLYPGIYTRVSRYRAWINMNTAGACFCSK